MQVSATVTFIYWKMAMTLAEIRRGGLQRERTLYSQLHQVHVITITVIKINNYNGTIQAKERNVKQCSRKS